MEEIPLSSQELQEIRNTLANIRSLVDQHGEELEPRHQRLYELITARSETPSTTSILELGCSNGNFVDYLREQGYNAEGVDIDKKAIERSNSPYLHHGDITCLDDVFRERKFDLVVATGVFNTGTQIYYLFREELDMDKKVTVETTPEHEEATLENIEKILKSAFKHLTPGGFLITVDNIMLGDYTAFTPETATNIGYIVKHYARQEAILQKPH